MQETIRGFNKRWKELEAGQKGLKQNLVLYNNFVREKQGKVADGMSIILIEKKKQKKVRIFGKFFNNSFKSFINYYQKGIFSKKNLEKNGDEYSKLFKTCIYNTTSLKSKYSSIQVRAKMYTKLL